MRSFLLERLLVVVVLRPSASAGGAVAAESGEPVEEPGFSGTRALTDCEPLGPADFETSEVADGTASLNSGAAELVSLGAENVNGHMRLPT